ncbi:MAG: hypothetical protein OEO83_14865 [Alphaproteobacteria bacterium]|nr:hypothetical protein [Alphaproteobacteria bacterium]
MVQTKTEGGARAGSGAPGPRRQSQLNGAAAGQSQYDRRLSDKILAAFNHAYATGAHKVADRLRHVLQDVETAERHRYERRSASAVSQADLWVSFIRARNGYNDLVARSDAPPEKVESALEAMKDAYRVWADN